MGKKAAATSGEQDKAFNEKESGGALVSVKARA